MKEICILAPNLDTALHRAKAKLSIRQSETTMYSLELRTIRFKTHDANREHLFVFDVHKLPLFEEYLKEV